MSAPRPEFKPVSVGLENSTEDEREDFISLILDIMKRQDEETDDEAR